MPSKFVQNTAARMGVSVEHAEKVWGKAKHAAKKGKRQGSWYWGKVVNTFKRMMGIKEHITFAEFKELLESDQGQNKNDTSERAMIHKIVELCHQAGLMKGGVKTEQNLELAYDFLESDWGGRLWDKHYELFHQMHPDFEGPMNRKQYGDFKREAVAWFKAWKNGRKLPDDVEPLPKLHESKVITLPQLLKTAPKKVLVGAGELAMYVLTLDKATSVKVTYKLTKLRHETDQSISLIVALKTFPGQGRRCLMQMSMPVGADLAWDERSRWIDLSTTNPLAADTLRDFARDVIEKLRSQNVLEDKKEDGVKKSYLDFKGSGRKKELKDEMKREIKRFSKMDHKDKDAYPDDWTADQKYKADLKKKGKKLPTSSHTSEYHRRYGK